MLEVYVFQSGVKVALSYACSSILQVETLRKKAEVMVSQENKPFPESNTAMV